jgi:hypothetical protein
LAIGVGLSGASAQEFGEIAREFRRNSDALRGHTWKSKVVFTVDGKELGSELYQVTLDTDGNVERKLISEEGKRTKQQQLAEVSLSGIQDLIDGYVHMSPESFKAAFGDNPRWVIPGGEGEPTRIKTSGVVHSRDTMEIWVDPGTFALQKLELDTSLQKEPVRLMAEFGRTEGGVTYVTKSTFYTHHKSKSMQIETENYEVERSGS